PGATSACRRSTRTCRNSSRKTWFRAERLAARRRTRTCSPASQSATKGGTMEREQATKFMYDLLRALLAKKGSDLFITSGFPPAMKIDSKMTPVSQQALTGQH